MDTASMYYHSENKAPAVGVAIFLLIAIAVGIVGGLIYGLAIWYIPFIYARVALPFGYGYVLGYCFNWGIKLGKIRGSKHQSTLALLGAIIVLYLAWAIWEAVVLESGNYFQFILDPVAVHQNAQIFNMLGLWGIGDSAVSGGMLWFCWIAEAVIIIGFVVMRTGHDAPFSETANNWAKPVPLPAFQLLVDPIAFRAALEAKQYDMLLNMEKGSSVGHHTEMTMYDSEGSEDYFLDVNLVHFVKDGDGNTEKQKTNVVHYIKIEPQTAREVMKKFKKY